MGHIGGCPLGENSRYANRAPTYVPLRRSHRKSERCRLDIVLSIIYNHRTFV